MALAKSQQSLKSWTKQKWRTKSGKPSAKTGERYLPSAAIKALSPQEYAATTKAKRAGKRAGKQHVKQPKSIAKKTRAYRKVQMSDNVININKKDYKVDDLDNKSKYIVAQIRDLEGKVANAKFQLDQHEIAKQQFVNLLISAVESKPNGKDN